MGTQVFESLANTAYEEKTEDNKVFEIPMENVRLVGEDSKKLNGDQLADMLNRFSGGNWGNVSGFFKEFNEKCIKKGTPIEGVFSGQYGSGGSNYRILAEVIEGQAKMLEVISVREDDKRTLPKFDPLDRGLTSEHR